jgi:hypothetical protein
MKLMREKVGYVPTHRHPLEQSTTEHQSRPFPTDLQTPSTLLLQSQTVYLHTTIDNFTLKFVVQYPICYVACNL